MGAGRIPTSLHFYHEADIRAWATTPAGHLIWRPLVWSLSRLLREPYSHVNLSQLGYTFEASAVSGFIILPDRSWPVPASISITLLMSRQISPEDWLSRRLTTARTIADACRLWPRWAMVSSCVTATAEVLGIRRRCRVPSDILRQVYLGAANHVVALQATKGPSHTAASRSRRRRRGPGA